MSPRRAGYETAINKLKAMEQETGNSLVAMQSPSAYIMKHFFTWPYQL